MGNELVIAHPHHPTTPALVLLLVGPLAQALPDHASALILVTRLTGTVLAVTCESGAAPGA